MFCFNAATKLSTIRSKRPIWFTNMAVIGGKVILWRNQLKVPELLVEELVVDKKMEVVTLLNTF